MWSVTSFFILFQHHRNWLISGSCWPVQKWLYWTPREMLTWWWRGCILYSLHFWQVMTRKQCYVLTTLLTSDERNFALTIELMERIVGSRSSVMLLGFGYWDVCRSKYCTISTLLPELECWALYLLFLNGGILLSSWWMANLAAAAAQPFRSRERSCWIFKRF